MTQPYLEVINLSQHKCSSLHDILPVLLYCCNTWTVTKQLSERIDVFNMRRQRRIFLIPYTRHVTNAEVRSTKGCSAASKLMHMRKLQLFGHLARRSYEEDHHKVVVAAMSNPPAGWRRPRGRPRDTWSRIVSRDVQPFSIGVHSAWRLDANRRQWRQVVDTAMLQ